MLGRGKKLHPKGSNVHQNRHPSKLVSNGATSARLSSGKVFRKNAGRPWSRATQLG